jgi:hypothetical protein
MYAVQRPWSESSCEMNLRFGLLWPFRNPDVGNALPWDCLYAEHPALPRRVTSARRQSNVQTRRASFHPDESRRASSAYSPMTVSCVAPSTFV